MPAGEGARVLIECVPVTECCAGGGLGAWDGGDGERRGRLRSLRCAPLLRCGAPVEMTDGRGAEVLACRTAGAHAETCAAYWGRREGTRLGTR